MRKNPQGNKPKNATILHGAQPVENFLNDTATVRDIAAMIAGFGRSNPQKQKNKQ